MNIDSIILAAGKGTRMYSSKPKVLHTLGGRPMVQHVLDTAKDLASDSVNSVAQHVVIGHEAEQVVQALTGDVSFIEQTEQLGTGHAVAQTLSHLRDQSLCLVLYGDVPLIETATLSRLIEVTPENAMGLLTVKLDNPTGYGRIVRNIDGEVISIVEQKDASPEQLQIQEINTGILCVWQQHLAKWLPALSNDNAQGEYYLTDIIAMAVADGVSINTVSPQTTYEVEGVNNKMQLAQLERIYQRRQADALMTVGVTIADPERVDFRGRIKAGKDVYIDINAIFEGDVQLGNNVSIGPHCVIANSTIGDNTQIHANSVIEDACLAEGCSVGPFARLRPGAKLEKGAKIGNFVEVKNATFGEGSKANHLAYVGDAEVGSGSNIGAGTITCNYDGANKYKTTMGSNVFVGSNSTLVAPLSIEDNGFVAAGSTITQKVPESTLAVGRGKQKNISGWKRPTKK